MFYLRCHQEKVRGMKQALKIFFLFFVCSVLGLFLYRKRMLPPKPIPPLPKAPMNPRPDTLKYPTWVLMIVMVTTFLLVQEAQAGIALVSNQTVSGWNNGATSSLTISLPNNPTQNNLVIVGVGGGS